MRRIVVSAPRSGLNWLRFVVEDRLSLRTPGKTVLIDAKDQPEMAFLRSHDPLWRTRERRWFRRRVGEAYRRIDPAETGDDIVVLILRDYREAFVRSCRKRYSKYRLYTGNLEFFVNAAARRKAVFYYEDLVGKPEEMARLLDFLELRMPDGTALGADELAAEWRDMSARSRAIYDRNQSAAGGSWTRADPLNFRFHQRKLSPRAMQKLERHTREQVPAEALPLIARYMSA